MAKKPLIEHMRRIAKLSVKSPKRHKFTRESSLKATRIRVILRGR